MIELENCPHCKKDDVYLMPVGPASEESEWYVECALCQMCGPIMQGIQQAAEAWNAIATTGEVTAPPSDEEIEQVIRAFQYVARHTSRKTNRDWANDCIDRWEEYRAALQENQ